MCQCVFLIPFDTSILVYLFDDPLSALDSHVGREIFEQVIGNKGLLRGKTRILVTHRISLLSQMDQIIVLKEGRVAEHGSYAELLARKGDFADLIVQYLCEYQEEQETSDQDELQVIAELKEKVKPQLEQMQASLSESRVLSRGDSMEQFRRRTTSIHQSSRMLRSDSILSRSQCSLLDKQMEKRQKDVALAAAASASAGGKLIDSEHMEIGSVKWQVYLDYINALGVTMVLVTLVSYLLSHSCNVGTSLWLSAWADDALVPERRGDVGLRNLRLAGYAGFGMGETVFVLTATLTLNLACLAASKYLHRQMLQRIFRVPMSFFDTTPLGRILNRFTKDIDTADFGICINVRGVIVYSFRALVSFLLISLETPYFLLTLIPIGIFYYILQKLYINTSRYAN